MRKPLVMLAVGFVSLMLFPDAARAEEEEALHRHHVSLFAGGFTRHEDSSEETGAALGIEYEYRFSQHWGAGALYEITASDNRRNGAMVLAANWHPWAGLVLSAGPGAEFTDGETLLLGRVAAGYEFEFGRVVVMPNVSVDLTRLSATVVYGVTAGFAF